MYDLEIFAVTFLASMLGLLIFMSVRTTASRKRSVPGLAPTTKEEGNKSDIHRAGSLHEFLLDLHKRFGPIASFWLGKDYIVSIASPELFKQHQCVFDRPAVLFKLFEPLFGPRSIQYANREDGRSRRNAYDRVFSFDNIKQHYQSFQAITDELCKKWSSMVKEECIPLNTHMFTHAIKVDLMMLFGYAFKTDQETLEFVQNYESVWSEMEKSLYDLPEENSVRAKAFQEGKKIFESTLKKAIQPSCDDPQGQGKKLLLDALLEHNEDDRNTLLCDAITYTTGGFHTLANVLTWAFYFLATHIEVQEKAYREIKDNLEGREVDHTNVESIPYIRQIINETLRCALVAPYAARYQDIDSELGGYIIPKNNKAKAIFQTPVIHALGVMLQDEKFWPLPKTFDPDRFSPENVKSRPPFAFKPFGFAGKRMCPGYKLALAEATVCLVSLLGKFKVSLAEDQIIKPVHGLVTHPDKMIWIKIENR